MAEVSVLKEGIVLFSINLTCFQSEGSDLEEVHRELLEKVCSISKKR